MLLWITCDSVFFFFDSTQCGLLEMRAVGSTVEAVTPDACDPRTCQHLSSEIHYASASSEHRSFHIPLLVRYLVLFHLPWFKILSKTAHKPSVKFMSHSLPTFYGRKPRVMYIILSHYDGWVRKWCPHLIQVFRLNSSRFRLVIKWVIYI